MCAHTSKTSVIENESAKSMRDPAGLTPLVECKLGQDNRTGCFLNVWESSKDGARCAGKVSKAEIGSSKIEEVLFAGVQRITNENLSDFFEIKLQNRTLQLVKKDRDGFHRLSFAHDGRQDRVFPPACQRNSNQYQFFTCTIHDPKFIERCN